MRTVVAAALALFILVAGGMPHVHEGPFGRHACAACATANGERATNATPEMTPGGRVETSLVKVPVARRRVGAPLGSVPGQSPPRA